MKKALKIIGIVFLSIIVLLLVAPFLFAGTIENKVQKEINKGLNATVAWEDLNLSLFNSFPDAQLTLKNLSIVNQAPFVGDTLAKSEKVSLDMGLWQLFSIGDDPLSVNELDIENAWVNIKIDSLGNANYDIVKETAPTAPADTTGGLSFDIQHYEISNSDINYLDEQTNTFLRIKNLNHEGTGDFSAKTSTLETTSEALVSFAMDDVEYFNEVPLQLTADFKMDFENQKYTFLENEALVNQLPLQFEGFVKVNENNNEVNLTFKTPSSDFKNFLAVVPKEYSKNIENVETSGNFIVDGSIQGIIDEQHIPKMNISVQSENAAFKYPELPKKVENISIDANLINETGLAKDTYLSIDLLTFQIDEDVFTAHGTLKNLTNNMQVDMAVKGTMNLANLEKAYPLELEQDLNGILKADMTTQFDMVSLENEYYQNIRTNGTASISNFAYNSPEIPNQVNIATANLSFSPSKIELKNLEATSGRTDAKISGTLVNLMGFLFADQDLKGNFNLTSNTFDINDFMVAQTETSSEGKTAGTETTNKTGEEAIKIPSFLDVGLSFNAGQVFYDNLVLENVSGKLNLKDETAALQNVSASIFNGKIGLDGTVSTKTETPTFQMDLALSSINIARSFNGLELLQNLAPIAKALDGSLNTTIKLNGQLNNDLTPILKSIAGDALAQILTAKVNPEQMPLLSKLNGRLDFLNLDSLSLNNLQTHLEFNNGNVEIKPFEFNVKGIEVAVSGKHGFDNNMDYNLVLNLPARYLGSKVGGLLANLSESDLETMEVKFPIGLSGSFTDPKISLNTEKAVKNLTQQIIEKQKENLKEEASETIGDILTGNEEPRDSTTVANDSLSNEEKIKNAAGEILGGLFGRNKKDSTATKETP
ncbi:MAG TPA: AsmA-like C-terminal region-containing protein [Flavobacteriaceae bacterium]|nr:AsmA-like C-terminal region-containing protein [Flavobacteriaceae bacterium]